MFRNVWFEYLARESRYWWLHLIRGFAAIAFAVIAILWAKLALDGKGLTLAKGHGQPGPEGPVSDRRTYLG
jgi:hypothetical protein